jgi:hypothetical protein
MFLPRNGIAIAGRVKAGNDDARHKNDALRTSNPVAIPAGGVIVTRNWFDLAPPPINWALKSSICAM